jgi:hypothetical protein
MQRLFSKTINFYRRNGFNLTIRRAVSLLSKDGKYTFSEIYRNNHWGNSETLSGIGSTELATRAIRAHLPIIFSQWKTTNIIDAPCGDFNWFKLVTLDQNMSYTGIDIVHELIAENNRKHADSQHRFILADITSDPLPIADILICRDCLIHLSYKDIFKFLRNFVASETPFLLTTTYKNENRFQNTDIMTGEVRWIDLFSAPFSLPSDVAYRFDDPNEDPNQYREMCLWKRDQIIQALRQSTPRHSLLRSPNS